METEKTVRLEQWAVVIEPEPFQPPELARPKLVGLVEDHPKLGDCDGKEIITGTIRSAEGRIVRTNRTAYYLGTPKPEYMDWLKNRQYKFDPDHPVKWVKC